MFSNITPNRAKEIASQSYKPNPYYHTLLKAIGLGDFQITNPDERQQFEAGLDTLGIRYKKNSDGKLNKIILCKGAVEEKFNADKKTAMLYLFSILMNAISNKFDASNLPKEAASLFEKTIMCWLHNKTDGIDYANRNFKHENLNSTPCLPGIKFRLFTDNTPKSSFSDHKGLFEEETLSADQTSRNMVKEIKNYLTTNIHLVRVRSLDALAAIALKQKISPLLNESYVEELSKWLSPNTIKIILSYEDYFMTPEMQSKIETLFSSYDQTALTLKSLQDIEKTRTSGRAL